MSICAPLCMCIEGARPCPAGRILRRLVVPAAAVLAAGAGIWVAIQQPGGGDFGAVHLSGLAGLLSVQQ